MKKLIVIGLGILMSLSAHGQGSKRESVEELLRAANAASLIDGIYAQMNQVVDGMGQQLGVQPDEQAIFDAYMEKIFSAMREEMSWEKIEGPMIDIYLNHYTEKEIQDMLAFLPIRNRPLNGGKNASSNERFHAAIPESDAGILSQDAGDDTRS